MGVIFQRGFAKRRFLQKELSFFGKEAGFCIAPNQGAGGQRSISTSSAPSLSSEVPPVRFLARQRDATGVGAPCEELLEKR